MDKLVCLVLDSQTKILFLHNTLQKYTRFKKRLCLYFNILFIVNRLSFLFSEIDHIMNNLATLQ